MALALSVGAALQRDDVIQTLIDYHYDRVGMVIEQGTYAVKGSIVDVFPTNQNQPIRLDFFLMPWIELTHFVLIPSEPLQN